MTEHNGDNSTDIITLLRQQHEQVKHLLAEVSRCEAGRRQAAFDEVRAMLAVHETAEELILRPVTRDLVGSDVVDARNNEEKQATAQLARLEKLDASSHEFLVEFEPFAQNVLLHAQAEESLEFPRVLREVSAQDRQRMGEKLLSVERMAPTHAHPTAAGSTVGQALTGPFASIVDRVKDAVSRD